MNRLYLLILFLWCTPGLQAKGYYQITSLVRQAYQEITSLRLQQARTTLTQLRRQEPGNLMAHHLDNYLDFFEVYIREEESLYRSRLPNRDRRLSAIAGGEPRSPYHLYVQAEIRLHWALLRLRFGDYWSAFNDINQAHRLLLRNQELFPTFSGNLKDLGILHAAVGTVPDEYRWALQIISSLDGTVAQGKQEIERLLAQTRNTDYLYRQEAQVLYTFLLLHLDNRPEAAWQALQGAGLDPAANPLHCFVMANVAMRTGRNDQALQWLDRQPTGGEFMAIPFMTYMHGLVKLRRLEPGAKTYFESFVRNHRGRHFIKEAYQKLSWAELLAGNPAGYQRYMQLVKSRGHDSAGGDKNALREANEGQPPHLELLKARLLFDGSYFDRAAAILDVISPDELAPVQKLEYKYRRGRVAQGQKRYEEALRWFDEVMAIGSDNPASFACNSALQAGLIQEQRGLREAARRYYRACLRISPYDHATALHQQAKAGLSRLR